MDLQPVSFPPLLFLRSLFGRATSVFSECPLSSECAGEKEKKHDGNIGIQSQSQDITGHDNARKSGGPEMVVVLVFIIVLIGDQKKSPARSRSRRPGLASQNFPSPQISYNFVLRQGNLVLIQPRSSLPKICKNFNFAKLLILLPRDSAARPPWPPGTPPPTPRDPRSRPRPPRRSAATVVAWPLAGPQGGIATYPGGRCSQRFGDKT